MSVERVEYSTRDLSSCRGSEFDLSLKPFMPVSLVYT